MLNFSLSVAVGWASGAFGQDSLIGAKVSIGKSTSMVLVGSGVRLLWWAAVDPITTPKLSSRDDVW